MEGSMMQITYKVALEVATHEGIVRQAYKDSVGVWTWSVGLTNATGHDVTRYIGKPQSLEHCLRIYVWALDNYADAVRKAFRAHTLSEAQFAAALSFHWNTGAIARASWVKQWKAGQIAKAKRSFMNWTTPKEITARRRAERDLFFDGKWSQNGTMTEYTRVTSRNTPDWGSARKVDVSEALRRAMDLADGAPQRLPQPDPLPAPPDIPKPDETTSQPPQGGFFSALLRWLLGGNFR
jgi:lysozyme